MSLRRLALLAATTATCLGLVVPSAHAATSTADFTTWLSGKLYATGVALKKAPLMVTTTTNTGVSQQVYWERNTGALRMTQTGGGVTSEVVCIKKQVCWAKSPSFGDTKWHPLPANAVKVTALPSAANLVASASGTKVTGASHTAMSGTLNSTSPGGTSSTVFSFGTPAYGQSLSTVFTDPKTKKKVTYKVAHIEKPTAKVTITAPPAAERGTPQKASYAFGMLGA